MTRKYWPEGATPGTMPVELAKRINEHVFAVASYHLGLSEGNLQSLQGSIDYLREMPLEVLTTACRIVGDHTEVDSEDRKSFTVTVDERMIAAAYVAVSHHASLPESPEPIITIPTGSENVAALVLVEVPSDKN